FAANESFGVIDSGGIGGFVEKQSDVGAILVTATGECVAMIGGRFDDVGATVPSEDVGERGGQIERPHGKGGFRPIEGLLKRLPHFSLGGVEQWTFEHK